jgi:streptogramin lyase
MRLLGLAFYSFLVLSVRSQTVVDSFPSPGNEPRGLAWDGEYLWCADAQLGSLNQLDPSTGATVSAFSFNVQSDYGGITWGSDTSIWIANGRKVYNIDPSTADTISSFSCPGP